MTYIAGKSIACCLVADDGNGQRLRYLTRPAMESVSHWAVKGTVATKRQRVRTTQRRGLPGTKNDLGCEMRASSCHATYLTHLIHNPACQLHKPCHSQSRPAMASERISTFVTPKGRREDHVGKRDAWPLISYRMDPKGILRLWKRSHCKNSIKSQRFVVL